jgi:hypothetical protein
MTADVASKLQLKPGMTVAALGIPESVDLELAEGVEGFAEPDRADAVIAFAIDSVARQGRWPTVTARARG